MALENRRGFNDCPDAEGNDVHADGLVDGKLVVSDELVAMGRDGAGGVLSIFVMIPPIGGVEFFPKQRWMQIKDERPVKVMRFARTRATWIKLVKDILGALHVDGKWIVRRDLVGESHEGDEDTWRHGKEWMFAVKGGAVVGEEELSHLVNDTWAGPP